MNITVHAANAGRGSKFSQAEIYMRMFLDIRLIDAALFNNLSLANPIYDSLQEPTDIHKLKYILSNEIHICFISSINC